jgi:nicotinamide-nucleotide amidase
MALGCVSRLGVDVGIAITGVAGPAADDTRRPAGLVYVAVTVATGATTLRVQRLDGDRGREANRAGAVRAALHLCADALTA